MNQPTTTTERRLVVAEFLSLDGYIVAPGEDMSWVAEGMDPQMHEEVVADAAEGYDLFLFGRVTYDIFAAYWPYAVPYDEDDAIAPAEGKEDPRVIRALNERPKVVFSTTLKEPEWANTRVVRGGIEDEVRRLKQEPGHAMLLQGSASVVQALARADLVDEYHLCVHPVLLGAGTPLFAGGHERQDLDLTRLTRYPNGVTLVTYQRTNRTNGAAR